MLKALFFISIFLWPQFSSAQDLTCEDFKSGNFILPKSELIPFSFKITRSLTEQTEQVLYVPDSLDIPGLKDIQYEKIEWISECSYILRYDTSKMNLDSIKRQINNGGGLLVELKEISGNCASYLATTTMDGEKTSMSGTICKVKN